MLIKSESLVAMSLCPKCCVSELNNGPQFRSQEYENFAKEWKFEHPTSSPYHSQSNVKAESAVKIAKKLMTKAEKDHGDLQLAILDWRNTPTDSSNKSPVQNLHSRHT